MVDLGFVAWGKENFKGAPGQFFLEAAHNHCEVFSVGADSEGPRTCQLNLFSDIYLCFQQQHPSPPPKICNTIGNTMCTLNRMQSKRQTPQSNSNILFIV